MEAIGAPPVDGDTEWLKERYGFDTSAARAECLHVAGSLAGLHVLDVGTGSGLMAAVLARSRGVVTSIEIKFQVILRAQDRLSGAGAGIAQRRRLVVADALRLTFRSDSFDAVFCFDSMHHMPDCTAAAREMERVLKPGGRLVMADLNSNGLAAIRSLNAARGESHEENAWRLENLGRILRSDGGHMDRGGYRLHSANPRILWFQSRQDALRGSGTMPAIRAGGHGAGIRAGRGGGAARANEQSATRPTYAANADCRDEPPAPRPQPIGVSCVKRIAAWIDTTTIS